MQFHLNRFRPGDPHISGADVRHQAAGTADGLPTQVKVLIVQWRYVAGLCPSLPNALPGMARTLARKAGFYPWEAEIPGDADLYGSVSVKWFFGLCRFLVWSGKAVPRPVACDQVRGARGRGQGTEMLA